MCVLEGNGCNSKVDESLFLELMVGGGDDAGKGLCVDLDVVASLGEGDAVNLAGLNAGRLFR